MALRNIVVEGDAILTKKARRVSTINERTTQLLDDMIETMRDSDGVGLAAPQVGVLRRVFVVEIEGELYEMINPEILEMEGVQTSDEGCLSVPGMIGKVERPQYIKMKALDRGGKEIYVEGTDLMAVALCHEYDHLEGILFNSKATDLRELVTEEEESEEQ